MPLKAAPEDQALLLDLQALDIKLGQLAHRVAKLPETAAVAELASRRDGVQAAVLQQTGAWEDARTELKRTEADVQVVETRMARDLTLAYYAHPTAWSEIGWGGPASPRGYVRMDLNERDPWEAAEVKDGDTETARRKNRRVG